MWSKEFRLAVFFSIYQVFFWQEIVLHKKEFSGIQIQIDYEQILEQVWQEVFLKKILNENKNLQQQEINEKINLELDKLTEQKIDSQEFSVNHSFFNLVNTDLLQVNYKLFNQNLVNLSEYFDSKVKLQIVEQIDKQVTAFNNRQSEIVGILSKYTVNWSQTFPIVKACLCTFFLEKENFWQEILVNQAIFNKLVSIYIRLTQKYVSSKNVSLVHAIISKFNPNPNTNKNLQKSNSESTS